NAVESVASYKRQFGGRQTRSSMVSDCCRAVLLSVTLAAITGTGVAPAMPQAAPPSSGILARFLALDDTAPAHYRALRHLNARNDKFNSTTWMEVWTEGDARGFRYDIVAEGGSGYIRSRVFRGTLEAEQRTRSTDLDRASITPANYHFEDPQLQPEGLVRLTVTPKRKELLLVNGAILLDPKTGDLVRIEGQLSRAPSLWTRNVKVVRRYERIAGVRVPIALETT